MSPFLDGFSIDSEMILVAAGVVVSALGCMWGARKDLSLLLSDTCSFQSPSEARAVQARTNAAERLGYDRHYR